MHLSRAYLEGQGVPADPVQAWAWAEVGHRRAVTVETGSIAAAVASNADNARTEAARRLDEAGLARARALADERGGM